MKPNKLLSITSLTLALLSSNVMSAEKSDYEKRESVNKALELRIQDREYRLTEQANDLLRLHHRMGDKLDKSVKRLTSIKDSAKSGFRVSKTKLDFINGLQEAVEKFQRARRMALEDIKKVNSETQRKIQAGELDHFDSHIEKHIEQIIKVSKSFTQDTNVEKYEQDGGGSYYDDYYFQESTEISDEYRQNRRDRIMDEKQKKEVKSALTNSTERCRSLISNLQRQLDSKKLNSEDAKLIKSELKNHRAMLRLRERQIDDLIVVSKANTTEVNRNTAIELSKSMDDLLEDIQKDLHLIYIKHIQMRRENTNLYQLKEKFAAQKKWLETHKEKSSN
jgi:hypothetical protein